MKNWSEKSLGKFVIFFASTTLSVTLYESLSSSLSMEENSDLSEGHTESCKKNATPLYSLNLMLALSNFAIKGSVIVLL